MKVADLLLVTFSAIFVKNWTRRYDFISSNSIFVFKIYVWALIFLILVILCISIAGYIAHLMGLPINLVGACNQNDAFHQILSKGVFCEPEKVLKSTSCSMDIMVS